MKIISLLILLALLILPTWAFVLYVLYTLLTKGISGVDELYKRSPRLGWVRSRPRLFYSTLALYNLILFALMFLTIYLFFSDINWFPQFMLALSLGAILVGGIFIWAFLKAQQFIKQYPAPDVEPYTGEYLEWENKKFDELTKSYPHNVLIFTVGGVLVVALVAGVLLLAS